MNKKTLRDGVNKKTNPAEADDEVTEPPSAASLDPERNQPQHPYTGSVGGKAAGSRFRSTFSSLPLVAIFSNAAIPEKKE